MYANVFVHECRAEGVSLLLPVAVLHFAAFTMGYFLSKGLKFNEKTARTVSIETGTLCKADVKLALLHFGIMVNPWHSFMIVRLRPCAFAL